MANKPYPDETGKAASSKIKANGLSDWQERYIEDKAKQKFGVDYAGGDAAGAWMMEQRKRTKEINAKQGTQANHAVTDRKNSTKPVK
jgi:hypothetical protein